jgi:O-acetyl-ADP-ribose deacetylase (regulator of RNase III)
LCLSVFSSKRDVIREITRVNENLFNPQFHLAITIDSPGVIQSISASSLEIEIIKMSDMVAEKSFGPDRKIRLVHGDLTEAKVDAIVNAANAQLAHGGGVAGAIVRKGGRIIQEESTAWVKENGPITNEKPAITSSGDLPCRFVIHAVGPVWGEGEEDRKLFSAVYSALDMAQRHQFKSLALPAISTGIFGFPKDRGAQIILNAILEFFENHEGSSLTEVQIVLIDQPSIEVFAAEFAQRWPESVL